MQWEYTILKRGEDGMYITWDTSIWSKKEAKRLLLKRRGKLKTTDPDETFVIMKDEERT